MKTWYVKGYCPMTNKNMDLACYSREQAEEALGWCNKGTITYNGRIVKSKGVM